MTKLLAPRDENELILLTSLLKGDGIDFLVQNEYFGSLYPGLNIFPFNERVILVAEADLDRASLLARDFLESIEGKPRQGGQVG
jgi:Putative prokaryotic signal transducing protein